MSLTGVVDADSLKRKVFAEPPNIVFAAVEYLQFARLFEKFG